LLLLGLSQSSAETIAAEARALGVIVDPSDPRRRVAACAGAPVCASGQIPTRALAPRLAEAARLLPAGEIIHLSGCAKNCAHPSPAALAVVGRAGGCDLLVDGALQGRVNVEALPQRLAELARSRGGTR
jgi:precorrin-3B synthase